MFITHPIWCYLRIIPEVSVTLRQIAEKPTTRPTKKPTEETTGTTETKIVTTEREEENLETTTATKSPPPTTPAPSPQTGESTGVLAPITPLTHPTADFLQDAISPTDELL